MRLQFLGSIMRSPALIDLSVLQTLLSSPYFLENTNASFYLAVFHSPRGPGYFMTMNWRSWKGFASLPCALLCTVLQCPRQKRFAGLWSFWITGFLLRLSLWLCQLSFLFQGHLTHSKANKILLDDSYYLYTGTFFLLLLKCFLVLKRVTLQTRHFQCPLGSLL